MAVAALAIQNVVYGYPNGTPALRNINLTIAVGQRVAIVGANGSGKSTLLHHLNGLLLPQAGQVQVGNWRVTPKTLRSVRDCLGLVFQNPDDQLFMPSVWEDVTFGPKNQGLSSEIQQHRAIEAMKAVGLKPEDYAHRMAHALSGGEKKRVAIAGVLAMQPSVLALDEPSAQLDPRSRRQLIHLLDRLSLTQIIATHDLDLALDLCERTVVLHRGEIVYDGSTAAVMGDPDFLEQYALEVPLSCQRPYCLRSDGPVTKL
ncbi:energy-coupling factor ABC transporter ATP-binding protein [Alkalinema pantanalense CENA528]|uniref:energy-coupling factor ABC transporter ATP-binding protein n=1 Tax=Alkalinema pantanalense TaxID=1620705 RepID=UPI003D6FE127